MKTSKPVLTIVAAIVTSLSAVLTSAIAADDDLVFLCYRSRTIQVPSYLVPRYILKGATTGACLVTP